MALGVRRGYVGVSQIRVFSDVPIIRTGLSYFGVCTGVPLFEETNM